MPTTYENQVNKNEAFWIDNQPEEHEFLKELIGENRPTSLEKLKGKVYDITGFNARCVVALLSHIMNAGDETWAFYKTFYFLIKSNGEEVFKLQAMPNDKQPGNGLFSYRPRGHKKFTEDPKTYPALCGAVEASCSTNQFATHIKQLFQDNENIHVVRPATAEAYILLLFEIARRLVRPIKNDSQRELDELPIGSAIARAVNLLLHKAISFKQFFFDAQDYHCFTGAAQTRKKAIEKINNLHAVITSECVPVSSKNCLTELRAMFEDENEEHSENELAGLNEEFGELGLSHKA